MRPNNNWHGRNDFAIAASVEARLTWYLKHAANCGCAPIPGWVMRELSSRGFRLPTGYDETWRARGSHNDFFPGSHFGGRGAA